MDPEKFKAKTKKVAGTTKVDIVSVDYLNPEYELEVLSNERTTPTGLLEVVKLNPKKPDLPQFIFRWDEKTDRLDVDIYKNGINCKDLWKKPGHEGHQTQRVSGEDKIFEADISTPDKKIFKGKINVGLFIKLVIKDSIKLTDRVEVIHKKVKIEDTGKGVNDITANKNN